MIADEDRVRSAVVLAAGDGGRLKDIHPDLPKGFLRFGDKSIIEESIERLLGFGIEEIIIVVGFQSQYYRQLSRRYACVKTVNNQRYNDSGTMYSLWCAKDVISADFLLLESDLIYEPMAIDELLRHPAHNVTLLSGFTNAGDEVFVETTNDMLVNMNKDKSRLRSVSGEFVGISKVSFAQYREMLRWSQGQFKDSLFVDYETDAFVWAANSMTIYCHKVTDLVWCEIDNNLHYINARDRIYSEVCLRSPTFRGDGVNPVTTNLLFQRSRNNGR